MESVRQYVQGGAARVSGIALPGLAFLLGQRLRGRRDRFFRRMMSQERAAPGPILVVVSDSRVGEELLSDLEFYSGSPEGTRSGGDATTGSEPAIIDRFFGWEILPFDALSPTVEISASRLATLHRLRKGERSIVIASVDALMQRVIPPHELESATYELTVGDPVAREDLVTALAHAGYVRGTVVEERGQMAVRGAVVDLFPPAYGSPIRFELFGDRIESIRSFDPSTQRSLAELEKVEILPVREVPTPQSACSEGETSILDRLLNRARELDLSSRDLREIEEGYRSGARWPGIEHLLPLLVETTASLWDYLPSDADVVVFDELAVFRAAEEFAHLLSERAEVVRREGRLFPEPRSAYASMHEVKEELAARATFFVDPLRIFQLDTLPREEAEEGETGEIRPVAPQSPSELRIFTNEGLVSALRSERRGDLPLQPLAKVIEEQCRRGFSVVIAVSHSPRLRRMRELLESYDIPSESFEGTFLEWFEKRHQSPGDGEVRRLRGPSVTLVTGSCSGGIVSEDDNLQVISDRELFPDTVRRRRLLSVKKLRRILGQGVQFKEGDFVVHVDHGIARYGGLRQMTVEGKVGDFLLLEYADDAKLFLPVDHIGKVEKYIGAEGKPPTLTRLGARAWQNVKARVKKTVTELAGQLVNLYAEREIAKGFSFGPIDEDDERFAATFPFEETPDQERAIRETLEDMARPRPMDRLICGDVGYGKTEVALRAAFKAANRGKQTVVLVPTTVLADQHCKTFQERFADFPVRVGCVSRFSSSEENRETLRRVATGEIDIIVGTHRLLSRDVVFHDLGLLIIDEEHRFGVAHKEKLKRMRREIDVLTLTATPIPRTLHMSLVGIRDLSVIETPPTDRQVIRTYLANYDEGIVREAILRELQRSGQVFYIWNRVETIANVTAELRALVPEARVEFAHGQMRERELEEIMHCFLKGEINVLVSTTIVESGLDVANANTIIIRDADRFGLAELYQLRGRVGRSSRRAYAYLFISDPHRLGSDARKRLQVLESLDDLGMGFRLALQDMEIRGAGNLLGRDQSGHIALVGFDLYSRILKEAIREIRSREREETTVSDLFDLTDPEISVGFPAHIPPFYIPDVAERLLLYQRLVELRDPGEGEELAEEIRDRFGGMPREVECLVELMVLRSFLRQHGIVALSYRAEVLRFAFHREAVLDTKKVVDVVAGSRGRVRVSPDRSVLVRVPAVEVSSPFDLYRIVRDVLIDLGKPSGEIVLQPRFDA